MNTTRNAMTDDPNTHPDGRRIPRQDVTKKTDPRPADTNRLPESLPNDINQILDRLTHLELENRRLAGLVAALTLDKLILEQMLDNL